MSEEPDDGWELVQRRPPPGLGRLLTRVCGYREWAGSPVRRWEPPAPTITVVLGFQDPISVIDEAGQPQSHLRFVAGLATQAARTQHGGVQEGLQLDLTPAGARVLLGVAPGELVGRTVDIDRVSGPLTDGLVNEVAEADTWEARLATVERRLIAALPDVVAQPAQVEEAWDLLKECRGKISVTELARRVGWSARHLSVQFHREVGLPPSVVAGIFRARYAVSLLSGPDDLAMVAARAGYSDQPHMTRQIKRFMGRTPSILRHTHTVVAEPY